MLSLSTSSKFRRERTSESGASLVVTLLMIVVVASLAAASARFALSGERSTRADRDRELALQAAETALIDGQNDILSKPGVNRGTDFCGISTFPTTGCSASTADRGKCSRSPAGTIPSWLSVDWAAEGVPVGTFTGGAFYPTEVANKSWLPATAPRYVIEPMRDDLQDTADSFAKKGDRYLFLVTAVGYATRSDVKVVLQSTVRKPPC